MGSYRYNWSLDLLDANNIKLARINLFLWICFYICTYMETILILAHTAQQVATSGKQNDFGQSNQQDSQRMHEITISMYICIDVSSKSLFEQLFKQLVK